MSQRPKSRKKNVVEGNVAEITRQGEGLGLERVGEKTGFFARFWKKFRKECKR